MDFRVARSDGMPSRDWLLTVHVDALVPAREATIPASIWGLTCYPTAALTRDGMMRNVPYTSLDGAKRAAAVSLWPASVLCTKAPAPDPWPVQ